MFSLGVIATTSATALLLFPRRTHGFISPPTAALVRPGWGSLSPAAPTRMSYAPKNVQDVWDNHFAAFGGKDMKNILLDYDENSVITAFDETADQKHVFEGVEGARTIFEGLFHTLSENLAPKMVDVSEDSKVIFFVWSCPASGIPDATDTLVLNAETNKIYRQTVAYKTGTTTTHQPQYGKAPYWDDRYTKGPEIFDWYQRYSGLKDWISQYVRKDDNVLMVGCGNSRLSEDMFDDGFTTLTNIDVSSVVVDQMVARNRDRPALSWLLMDVCALDFPDESFNSVVDKGTLDSVLCGEGSTANVAEMCMEISRVLKPNGVYFICSYGLPDNRLQYLENDDYSWTVTVNTIPKPTVSAAAVPDTRDAESVHYLYVCKKGRTAEEGA